MYRSASNKENILTFNYKKIQTPAVIHDSRMINVTENRVSLLKPKVTKFVSIKWLVFEKYAPLPPKVQVLVQGLAITPLRNAHMTLD